MKMRASEEVGPVGMVTCEGDVRLPAKPARGYPRSLPLLRDHLSLPNLEENIRRFLYDQLNPNSELMGMEVDIDDCPRVDPGLHIKVYHSAASFFHAPSDTSGIGGMQREYIRATPSWQRGPPRHDCVYVESNPEKTGFEGLTVAQCAFVRWFETFGNAPCNITGLWRVKPDVSRRSRRRITSVISIDSILRSAHLLPVYGTRPTPRSLHHSASLDVYRLYYVNRYIDYHAHETIY
ncbi:hypothetical protein NMY22_g12732 [Coprinellus aureogranulatus]|nr:hypothetical protein NMY22_g12732 [Coprinellus aureogranulatus]